MGERTINIESSGVEWMDFIEGNEEEIVKRYNMYPKLVEALEDLLKVTKHVALRDSGPTERAEDLLRKIK